MADTPNVPTPAPASQQPPVLPLNFFYWQYNRAGRRLFVVAYALLLLFGVYALVADSLPGHWAYAVVPDSYHQSEPLTAYQGTHNYRELSVQAQGSWNFTVYGAGLLQPTAFMLGMLLLALMAGWSLLLAASARIEGIWGYIVYLGHALFIYLADASGLLFHHPSAYLALIPIFGFILPAYLFKEQLLKASLWAQFWLFMGLHLLLFGLVTAYSGYPGLFQLGVTGYPVHMAVVLLVVLVSSKEVLQLFIYWGNSRREGTRLSARALFWLLLPVTGFLLVQALAYIGLIPASLRLVSPMWVLVPAVLLMVFTAQNAYFQLRDIVLHNLAYSLLILGGGILTLGHLAYWSMAGEYTLRALLHKHTALLMGLVAVFQLIYLFANFGPLLVQRINVFFMLFKAPRFRFAAVWFAALLGVVLVEGISKWSGVRAVQAAYYQQQGDAQLVAGTLDTESPPVEVMVAQGDVQISYGAIYWYELAVEKLPISTKACYNLAAFRLARTPQPTPDDVLEISTLYKFAGSPREFPYAYINWGRMLAQHGQVPLAKTVLHRYAESYPHPHTYVALSGIYFHTQDPDSALLMLKAALKLAPDDGVAMANMAAIYHRHQRPKEALQFAEMAYEAQPQHPAVQENYWFLKLQSTDLPQDLALNLSAELAPVTDTTNYPYHAVMNKAVAAGRAGRWPEADQLAAKLLSLRETPDALLLRLITQAGLDSLEHAASRYQYLSEFYPPYKARAAAAMAALHYRLAAYQQARWYYQQAAAAGDARAALWEAYCLIDMGAHEKGYEHLQQVAVEHQALAPLCRQEMALLDSAYGLPNQFIVWQFDRLTPLHLMRLGVYAAARQRLHISTQAFDMVIRESPSMVAPYLEMAKGYAQEPDLPMAREQLAVGLKRHPNHPELLCALALLHLREGKAKQGLQTLEQAKDTADARVLATRGRLLLATGDTTRAIAAYQSALTKQPWHIAWLEELATVYTLRKNPLQAYLLMTRAIKANDADPWLMSRYAWAAFDLGKYKDAREAMQSALQSAETFADIRKVLLQQQQDLEKAITRVEESAYAEEL